MGLLRDPDGLLRDCVLLPPLREKFGVVEVVQMGKRDGFATLTHPFLRKVERR